MVRQNDGAESSPSFESYVFEPYAALMLDTSYNSWARFAAVM
jgi:hypothetical protein